jgi:hypothetical protein
MAIVQVNVWSDGIGFVGCLVLGIVYTGYHIFLRFQRQAKVSHVTT